MYERFTQGARRVVFFAAFEARQYGSPWIETEHLLLGLLREGRSLEKWFPGESNVEPAIRGEIEKRITRREQIEESRETPLSQESKKVLVLAADTADQLGHHDIDLEHLLIAILRVETSVAAQILIARGLKAGPTLERFAKSPPPRDLGDDKGSALPTLESFLSGLKSLDSENLISFFAKNAHVVDSSGKRWNRDDIRKGFETLFAPYGKKNASYAIEATLADTGELFVANIRWNNALLASEQRTWMHRMSVVLVLGTNDWEILLVQMTPVDVSAFRQAGGPETAR
jgi:Clp amino terminal domain, pathogenicity island component